MKKYFLFCIVIVLIQCENTTSNKHYDECIQSGKYKGIYWPTNGWQTCDPSDVGMDSDDLYKAYEYAMGESFNTHGLVVIRKGYIVGEYYDANSNSSSRFPSYSVAKSFLSALVGIAIEEGHISNVNDYAKDYLWKWGGANVDERKKQITVKHLLGMASGIEWNEDYSDSDNDIMQMVNTNDYLEFMINKPTDRDPFTYWEYNTGNSVLLSGVLHQATDESAYQYGREKLFIPMGIDDISWDSDPKGLTVGGWGIRTTVRSYAKFGYLFLNSGKWDDQQLVPENWVNQSVSPITENIDYYGLHWWILKGFGDFDLPDDIYLAIGIHGQIIYVIPSKNIVIAKFSSNSDPLNADWEEDVFLKYILDSLD